MKLILITVLAALPMFGVSACRAPATFLNPDEVLELIRETTMDTRIESARNSVAIFELPLTGRPPGSKPPCTEAITDPAPVETIVPSPDYRELFASSPDGSLFRREGRSWQPLELPADIPPIKGLVGFVKRSSPPALVVGVDAGQSSELWTLTIQESRVVDAVPTDLSRPEYSDRIQFLQRHHTPRCREGDRQCLQSMTVAYGQVVVQVLLQRLGHDFTQLGMIIDPSAIVTDIAWAGGEGHSLYLAVSGARCLTLE